MPEKQMVLTWHSSGLNKMKTMLFWLADEILMEDKCVT